MEDQVVHAEASLLLQVSHAVAANPQHVSEILSTSTNSIQLPAHGRYISAPTLLKAVLKFACPSVAVTQVVQASHAIINNITSQNADLESLEAAGVQLPELSSNFPDSAVVSVADDLVASLSAHAESLFWTQSSEEPFVDFAKALAISVASVDPSLRDFITVRPPTPSKAYDDWLNYELRPYKIYYDNFASTKKNFSAVELLSMEDWWDQFASYIEPLQQPQSSESLQPSRYLTDVIIPLARRHNYDLRPFSTWMLDHKSACDSVASFKFWHAVFEALSGYSTRPEFKEVTGGSPLDFYDYLVRQYLFSVLYYAGYKEIDLPPTEAYRIQDQIHTTLELLSGKSSFEEFSVNVSAFPSVETLKEFIHSDGNPAAFVTTSPLESVIGYLSSTIQTCLALGKLQRMPVKTYLELKAHKSKDDSMLQKHVLQVMTAIEPSDYNTLMKYIQEFKNAFCVDSELEKDIDKAIFERLLQIDQFENATKYLQELPEQRASGSQVAFHITYRKFWDLLMKASNLDERIGKLKLATQCVGIMESMCANPDADESMRNTVVKIKHLFKAFGNIKNFKLVLERNQPVTPKQILEKLTQEATESTCPPMSLISLILEQNPKSYLAYEKLFKTVNDFSIYCDVDLATVNSAKVQSICVESALIDGNFDFAYKHATDLLHHCVERGYNQQLGENWLMFYQVGKFIQPEWFNDYDQEVQDKKLVILKKQRTILSLAIKHLAPSTFTVDNSRLLVAQFKHINQELKKWYEEAEQHRSAGEQKAMHTSNYQIQENISGLLNDAAISKNHASEKISNLFVSGLGWAIGAKRN